MSTELRLVATYMRRSLDYQPKKLREELYKWCEAQIVGYKRELYYKQINSAINKACKKGSVLTNIDYVDFYNYEMDYIDNLHIMDSVDNQKESEYAYECKKLLFTLMFKMTVNKLISETKSTKTDFKYKGMYFKGGQKKYTELKKLAKLPEKIKINEDIINTLWKNGYVSPMYNGLIKLNFMEKIYEMRTIHEKKNKNKNNAGNTHETENKNDVENKEQELDTAIALQIKDFDSVGWYFDFYKKDKKIVICKECEKIFIKDSNRREYCSDECSKKADRKKAKERMKTIRSSRCSIQKI